MAKLGLLIFMLFVVSCTFIGRGGEEADISGKDGLKITIGKTPKELFVGQGTSIPVTVENVGLTKIENAALSLSGFNQEYVTVPINKFEGINLEPRTQFTSSGEKQVHIFQISNIRLPELQERRETFEVTGCYQYKTEASPVVCINPQIAFGEPAVQTGGCTFTKAQISSSQGAPIAVSRVESIYNAQGTQVEFVIYVEDVLKKGTILEKSKYAKRCLSTDPIAKKDLNVITIKAFLAGQKINCVDLSRNQADRFTMPREGPSIRCIANIDPQQSAFTSLLSIDLEYGYAVSKVFSIDLKSSR